MAHGKCTEALHKLLGKQGIAFKPLATVIFAKTRGSAESRKEDVLLVSVGCWPLTGGFGLGAVGVIAYGGTAEDIARTSHAHVTLTEGIVGAALGVVGRKIYA